MVHKIFIKACRDGNFKFIEKWCYVFGPGYKTIEIKCNDGNIRSVQKFVNIYGSEYKLYKRIIKKGFDEACKYGNIDIVKFLIRQGVSEWERGLENACQGGYKDIARILCINWDQILIDGLSGACKSGRMDMVQFMLEYDYLYTDINRHIEAACYGGNIDIIKLFIKNCDDRVLGWGLSDACAGGHIDAVKFMIEKGAGSSGHLTAIASRNGDMNMVKFLYEIGSKHLCLSEACEGGNIDIVKLIIQKIPPQNAVNYWHSGMRGACESGNIDIANLMIQTGVDESYWGLKYACKGGNMDIVKLMIEMHERYRKHDFMPTWKDAEEWHQGPFFACLRGHTEVVKFLINNKLYDPNSCLSVAHRYGHMDIVKFIYDSGLVRLKKQNKDFLKRYKLFEEYMLESVDQLGLCQDISGLIKEYII